MIKEQSLFLQGKFEDLLKGITEYSRNDLASYIEDLASEVNEMESKEDLIPDYIWPQDIAYNWLTNILDQMEEGKHNRRLLEALIDAYGYFRYY